MQKINIRQITGKRSHPADTPYVDLAERFEQFYPKVYNYLRYRVSNPADAEDLVSAAFERAYTSRHQFDESKGSFSTWLFSIARNILIDHHRARRRHAAWVDSDSLSPDLVTAGPTPETQVVQQEMVAAMLESLAHLGERDQEIISLKFAGRLKNKEIGEILGMKEKTVSVALLRAMRRLRQHMEQEAA